MTDALFNIRDVLSHVRSHEKSFIALSFLTNLACQGGCDA